MQLKQLNRCLVKNLVYFLHANFIPTPLMVYKTPLLFTVELEIKKPFIPIYSLLLITRPKLLLMKRLINSNNKD